MVEAAAARATAPRSSATPRPRLAVALEHDEPAAPHAAAAYPSVSTSRANLAAMPVAAASADLLVCLQVVEHLWDLRGFLADCVRVLRPGGVAVVSTPNRPVFSPGLGRRERPTNPFHVEELDSEQLDERLRTAGFADVDVLGLRHGPRIEAWESLRGTGIVAAQISVVTGAGPVPADLASFVAGVTVDDFTIGSPTARRTSSRSRWRHRPLPVGTFCLVLHTHLPWLAHHGAWPVGEEWLHQAWATSYLPVVVDVLDRLAAEGRTDLLTLGVTPVVRMRSSTTRGSAASSTPGWASGPRAPRASPRTPTPRRAPPGTAQYVASQHALAEYETRWSAGLSPVLRPLVDSGAVELLGGPATHPFQPLLDRPWQRFALRTGLDDAALRLGSRPEGIWAPECGYRPGLEDDYADLGVRRFLVDGPRRRSPRAARRRPARRSGQRRRRLRARPRRHLPRVVAAQGLPRRALGPRLPHLRPRLGLPRLARHEHLDAVAREVPLRPGARGAGGARRRRRLRRRRTPAPRRPRRCARGP